MINKILLKKNININDFNMKDFKVFYDFEHFDGNCTGFRMITKNINKLSFGKINYKF
jgi:hypothetical protein